MPGPFVHRIDPVIFELGGVYFWWYGLSYSLGFLCVFLWFRRHRKRMAMTHSEVFSITLFLSVGVLLGGRFVEVVFYELDFYRAHPLLIPAYWLGGMATHGLLLGGTLGVLLFCLMSGRTLLQVADELAIPVAWIMGVGRLGNFIDGQISGAVTDVWWAVQFPDLEGFRHPVVLYDGLKNLLLIPLLFWVSRRRWPQGVVIGHFVFWYAFLRIFVDLFREYRVETFGIETGQLINIAMAVFGFALLIWLHLRAGAVARAEPEEPRAESRSSHVLWPQRSAFVALLVFCMTIPSDWTQDIPARYGVRHPGMSYSSLYPRIEERIPVRASDEADPDAAESSSPAP
jgi:phosphatidylglycerol:prolipoprotein diacylglycerol transferase